MPATLMKTCRTCRFVYEFPARCETFACPACDALNGRPQAEGSALESLSRATAQRLRCDFHNAVNSYQHVLLDSPEEHEALWGLALCRYGVEYVDDPKTGRRMPTVHSVRRKPMQLDPDYLAALDCAPEDVRVQYEQEAQYIDDAMAKIIELSEKCPPFDVFLCHKTTKPDSEAHTKDYDRAFDLYHELTMQGYKVFFAPKEMAGVAAGSDYEAAIYHALDTAKVMLLICSDADYLTSAWVRSEWTRFLEMADEKQGKCLLPLMYGGFAETVLPKEIRFRRLQCIRMEDLSARESVFRIIASYAGKRGSEVPLQNVQQWPTMIPQQWQFPVIPQISAENLTRLMDSQNAQLLQPQPHIVQDAVQPNHRIDSPFTTEEVSGGVSITGYSGSETDIKIPDSIKGKPVVGISDDAFEQNEQIEYVSLPEGIRYIGSKAFRKCVNLIGIHLSKSIERIGEFAFDGCYSVRSGVEELPERIAYIGSWAFRGCYELKRIYVPDTVKHIGQGAFDDCNHLVLLVSEGTYSSRYAVNNNVRCMLGSYEAGFVSVSDEPDGVRIDEFRCFTDAVDIPSKINGKKVVKIGCNACRHNRYLIHITIPEGVQHIEDSAFYMCDNLESVSISEGLISIGNGSFGNCRKLESLNIPASVSKIRITAFDDCDKLTLRVIPDTYAHGYVQRQNLKHEVVASVVQYDNTALAAEVESSTKDRGKESIFSRLFKKK